MTTVAERLAADDTGGVWLLEVSFDDFASVAYRWATASYRDGSGNQYDGRISSVTPVMRGFGRDHLPAAATVTLHVDNSDFAADWMIDRSTVATQVLKARYRLSLLLFQASAYTDGATLNSSTQTIGYFSCIDQPELIESVVTLQLADDSLGRLAEPLTTPTVREWIASSSLNRYGVHSPERKMDWDVPLPLVFGLGEYNPNVPAYLAVSRFAEADVLNGIGASGAPNTNVPDTFPIVVCVSKAGTYQGTDELKALRITYRDDIEGVPEMRGRSVDVPRTFKYFNGVGSAATNSIELQIWKPLRSNVITKAGRSWQVVYLDFNVDYYASWFMMTLAGGITTTSGGGLVVQRVPTTSNEQGAQWLRSRVINAIGSFRVKGSPLSVVSTIIYEDGVSTIPSQRLVDHVYDLIAYYSKASPSDIDTTAFARASAARASVLGAGIVQPARPRPEHEERVNWVSPNPRDGIVGVLRTALGEMCGNADADLFMTKDGLYSIVTNVFDFTAVTAARVSVAETRIKNIRVRTPSQGERWAPFNRVMLVGPGGAPYGPYDNQAAITAWGTTLPVTLPAKWDLLLGEGGSTAGSTVWNYRNLESKVRPVIRFLADREYVAFELGEYFAFTWTRGGGSTVFNGTVFRVESLRIHPETLAVEVEAVWVDDLASVRPFLLDDENYLVRWDGTGGGTLTVNDGSAVITISGAGFVTNAVAAGDILELKDTTQAADVFSRYRQLRISSVDGASQVHVSDPDLSFGAGVPTAIASGQWRVLRGALTYPTSATDPTHYPSGSTFYGKCCDASNLFSDASAANQLLDG